MVDKKMLSAIHARFRQLRNGEVADNLYAQGISYKLAWGLESYRLREIAKDFEPSQELAEVLWNEEIRESKMLATRLYPTDSITKETAIAWVKEAKYAELVDQICMNMLAKMSSSQQIAEELADIEKYEPIVNYAALKLATRIELVSDKLFNLAESILNSDTEIFIKTAALWYKQVYEQS